MAILYLIIGLILFVGLVVLHELGHAIAARRNGVEVEEFGIGFPPKIWGKKLKNGTLLSLNWLPLGGFVKLKGEHDSATGPGTYGGANLLAKTKILLAGVVVNWLTAVVIFTFLALIGLPKAFPNQFSVPSDTVVTKQKVVIAQVVPDSPAAKAGLQSGDVVLSVNGVKTASAAQLIEQTAQNSGQTINVQVEHKNVAKNVKVSLHRERQAGQGYAGIAPTDDIAQRATWSAPIVGVAVTAQYTWETLKGLGNTIGHLFRQEYAQAGANVAGPVGIFSILQQSSEVGFVPVLFLIGIISLTLAVMNALPIPALDGGRLFVTVIFRLIRKPLTKEREESIQSIGFLTLLALIVLVTIVDVGRITGR